MNDRPTEWAHQKMRIPEPMDGEEVLSLEAGPAAAAARTGTHVAATRADDGLDTVTREIERLVAESGAITDEWVGRIEEAVTAADSFDALNDRLLSMASTLDLEALAELMEIAYAAADLAGRYEATRRG